MATIGDYLNKILSAVYGREVRQAIHDAIRQCYADGKVGAVDLVARERIDNLVTYGNTTEGNSELIDIRVGADGKTYDSAGTAVREQITKISDETAAMADKIMNVHVWEKFSDTVEIGIGEPEIITLYSWVTGIGATFSAVIEYSNDIGRNNDDIVLAEPVEQITWKTSDSLNKLNAVRGKYLIIDGCYRVESDAEFSRETSSGTLSIDKLVCSAARKVQDVQYTNSLGYVTSTNRNSYPNVGELNGYRYEYIGTVGQALRKIGNLNS